MTPSNFFSFLLERNLRGKKRERERNSRSALIDLSSLAQNFQLGQAMQLVIIHLCSIIPNLKLPKRKKIQSWNVVQFYKICIHTHTHTHGIYNYGYALFSIFCFIIELFYFIFSSSSLGSVSGTILDGILLFGFQNLNSISIFFHF